MSAKLHRQIRKNITVLKRTEKAEEHPNKMTTGERNVFLCLAIVARDDGTSIYCGVDFICEYTGLSRWWVQKCLRKLEYKGYIVPVANQKGGRGRPTQYHIPLNQFGIITPTPPLREEEKSLFLDDMTDQALPPIPETPTPGSLPVVIESGHELVSFKVGSDLHEIGRMYIGLIEFQAAEIIEEGGRRYRTKKWDDYQRLLLQCRERYNQALMAAGIQATDGRSPPLDDELEAQLQEWAGQAHIHKSRRDTFKIGSDAWRRWNDKTEKDMEAFESLLYQVKIQVTEEGIPI